jgi:hypothetical protein
MMKFILPLLFCLTAHGAVSEPDRALIETGRQILVNGGFEQGKASWVASGGTFTTTQTTANVGVGLVAGSINFSSAAQTLTSSAAAIPAGLYGQNGYLSCRIQTPSGTATHKLQVYDGSNVVGEQAITSSTAYVPTSLNFIIPSSGNLSARLIAVAADEPLVNIDDCKLGIAGSADSVSNVSQAILVGTVVVTGCSSAWSVANASYTAFGTQTGCSYAVTGSLQAPSTNIPGFSVASLGAGDYTLVYEGSIGLNSDIVGQIETFDGTNSSPEKTTFGANTGSTQLQINGYSHSFSYTTAQSNITFQARARSASSTISIYGTTASPGVFRLYKFPSISQQAVSVNTVGWKVDANISGANPSLGSASVSSYTEITNGSLTLANNSGNGNIAAQIPCSGTNAPSGTTCSAGSESVGVSFTVPAAGDVLACASFTHNSGRGGTPTSSVLSTFQIVETPNNAQTITQEGKTRVQSGNANGNSGPQVTFLSSPHRLCGTFSFSSTGQKTLRLMYEQTTNDFYESAILADGGASNGQRDIHWEVYPINQQVPAPILVGSVTSNSAGLERIERATIAEAANCTSSPCTITRQSGSWLSSVTRSAAGQYTLNIAAGIFSSPPTCSCISNQAGCAQPVTPTSTSFVFYTQDSAATPVDAQKINIICQGAR